ncbi:lipase family alpha/beta hydrolase [Marinisporobacter balticus]|uniref:Lecithin:cholesterol acyltransferase n=1 Tax=Marinisporobacter balticus TaxID=2018667 RepID=A0A4R2L2Q9_9FIRM|nr:alpha/beta hydrolase [Marinisporobacter balticus]TCO79507.1 lecithin:cholesterol acyltransferase [Marinisporobacter balticus]
MYPLLTTLGMLKWIRRNGYKQRKNPIVFVPGLYGSMGETIIPGTGDWGFGMSAPVYEPFIRSIEELGYKKDKDLFIAFYDWRKECTFCAQHYLKRIINEAKRKGRSKKVDIICHSMGGLVSRAYIQSQQYGYDVDQLIMIATPNAGAVNAYYFWAEGKLPYEKNIKSNIFRTILEGYLWILRKFYNAENDMEMIHNHLKSVKDLLPSYRYGDYLYFLDEDGKMRYIPYEKMQYQNEFLDQLNQNEYLLKRRKIKTTLIAGKGIETNNYLQVDRRYQNQGNRWMVGKVVAASKSTEGDGTVMLRSVFRVEGDAYVFEGTHADILNRCTFVIRKKLRINENNAYRSSDKLIKNYISILVSGSGDLLIKSAVEEGGILYDGIKKVEGVYVERYNEKLKWIVLVGFSTEQCYVEYVPNESGEMEIVIKDSFGKIKKMQEREVKINQTYRVNLS